MNLDEEVMKSLDDLEPNVVICALVEFGNKTLVFNQGVGNLL